MLKKEKKKKKKKKEKRKKKKIKKCGNINEKVKKEIIIGILS